MYTAMSFAYRLSSNLNSFRGCFKLWEGTGPLISPAYTSRSLLSGLQRRFKLWEGSRPYHAYVTSRPCLNRLSNMVPKPLLRCGVSSISGQKKKVVVCYTDENVYPKLKKQPYVDVGDVSVLLVSIPVDDLLVSIPVDEKLRFCDVEPLIQIHHASYFTKHISSIFTSTNSSKVPYLYFLGCLDKPAQDLRLFKTPGEDSRKEVYCYDPRKGLKEDSIIRCESMKRGVFTGLSVQIDDCIYILSYPSAYENTMYFGRPYIGGIDSWDDDKYYNDDKCLLRPLFQKYDIKKKKWDLVGDDSHSDIINLCVLDQYVLNIDHAPHVVIGPKLHVSIGNSSFTFDSCTQVWEKSRLFEKFWSEQKNKKSGLSPTNFYGSRVGVEWDGNAEKLSNGGQPLGFYGRGIIWDKNILIGFHTCSNCPLVAFLLDEVNGETFVLKSQPITFENVTLPYTKFTSSKLVDLGNGFFCLVYIVREYSDKAYLCEDPIIAFSRYMELLTFKVSKLKNDADHFLECKFVSIKRVHRKVPKSIENYFEAFSL